MAARQGDPPRSALDSGAAEENRLLVHLKTPCDYFPAAARKPLGMMIHWKLPNASSPLQGANEIIGGARRKTYARSAGGAPLKPQMSSMFVLKYTADVWILKRTDTEGLVYFPVLPTRCRARQNTAGVGRESAGIGG
jgi:hypothetical protein